MLKNYDTAGARESQRADDAKPYIVAGGEHYAHRRRKKGLMKTHLIRSRSSASWAETGCDANSNQEMGERRQVRRGIQR